MSIADNHEQIKQDLLETARAKGLSGLEVKVLSTDPYFVGTTKEYTEAKWAADLWEKMMARRRKPLHLRGFHYWIQSQGIAKPDGTKYAQGADPAKDWVFLLHAAQIARYLGLGTWSGLMDLKHPDPSDYDSYYVGSGFTSNGEVDIQGLLNEKLSGLVDEFVREIANEAPRYSDSGYQLYHLEVWCEKNSMGFVIEPACRKYEACYQPLIGQASVEKVNMAAARAIKAAEAGKRVRIFYISDWDRYGWSMVSAVARKLEFFIQEHPDCDVKLTRLALNEDTINKFKLPKAPKHGEAVVELDALEAIHPGELAKIISEALKPYYDEEKVDVVRTENRRIREAVREMLEEKLKPALTEAFENLSVSGLAGSIDLTEAINPDFEVPEPGHDVDDSDTRWVYDSTRTYWEQFAEYKLYKGEREEEEA